MNITITIGSFDILYMEYYENQIMKGRQLLSIVFSLIMIAGVSAGSAAYGQSDDLEEIEDILEDFCELGATEKQEFFSNYPEYAKYDERLATICDIEDENERADALDALVDEVIPDTKDYDEEDGIENETEDGAEYKDTRNEDLNDRLEYFCEMSDDDKETFFADHPRIAQFKDRLAEFCDIEDEDEREDAIKQFMVEFKDEHKMMVREMQAIHKELSDHKAEYERFCKMSEDQRASEIDDPEKLAKISEWCNMTPEERDAFKKEHHDTAMDFKEKHHDALERMKENKDLSHRLKDLILDDDEDSDEKISELKEKLKEKSREHENKKSELKEKFREHKSELKFRFSELTEQRKSDIRERHQEMKEFKLDILTRSDSLTDEEKQELRAEFIEKAKDMQLAWITPRDQVSAGIDPDQIECREGFSLVMKNSNGLPMCVKAHTAIKMIEKGYAVPVEPAN